MSSEDENENENRNENENKNENDKALMSSEDENKNAKNKKASTNTKKATNKNEDENKNILLEYMGEIDDKLFRKYSNGKNFSSFSNDFDRATSEKHKEIVVKEF